jgi:hypothetical protein
LLKNGWNSLIKAGIFIEGVYKMPVLFPISLSSLPVRTRFLSILMLVWASADSGYSQNQGNNPAVCTYKKQLEVAREGNLCTYLCEKLMGVYDLTLNKVITEPVFQYVQLSPYGFLGVKNNQVGYYASNGKTIIEPTYTQLGFVWNNVSSNEFIFFLNDSIKAGAAVNDAVLGKYVKTTMPYNWSGNQLHNLHCRMLEVKNGKVVVNHYDFTYTNDTGFEEMPQSGLYDIQTAKWSISRLNNYLVSFGNKHIGLVSALTENYPHAFNYRVYDENFKAIDIIADPATHVISVADVKKLLPYSNITNVELRNGPFVQGGLYYFESDGKAGLFQLDYLRVIQPPVYDAIFSPTSTLYMFTVKGNKTGWLDPYSSASVFEPVYDSIWAGGLRDAENTANGILLNGKWNVLLYKNTIEEVTDSVWKDFRAPYASIRKNGNFVFLEDVTPTFYATDPLQVMRGGETVDSVDAKGNPVYPAPTPGKNRSGMYDVSRKKWIVPQKYTTIGVAGMYYYGAVKSGHITLFDLYDATGKAVMPNFSAYMEISSTSIWTNITGYEGAVRTGRVECDTAVNTHTLHNAVYVGVEEGVGVFDLGKMKWIIEPRFMKIIYAPAEQIFKATVRDTNRKTRQIWFDKNGVKIKK